MPASIALCLININGTKNPAMVKKPLKARSMKDGDFNRDTSNIVAKVLLTASGHILHGSSCGKQK
jgi:hypothetical protein